MRRTILLPRMHRRLCWQGGRTQATKVMTCSIFRDEASLRDVPSMVPLIGRADWQFWSWPWGHRNSDKRYEFLTHETVCRKRYGVSGTLSPPYRTCGIALAHESNPSENRPKRRTQSRELWIGGLCGCQMFLEPGGQFIHGLICVFFPETVAGTFDHDQFA